MDNDDSSKRGKYNEKYDLNALKKLNLIMEDKEYWMTSLQLAKISGREHDKVMRDIRRDIVDKVLNLREYLDTANIGGIKINNELIHDVESFKYQEKEYKDSKGRTQSMYLLNRESSLLCLVRYNFIIQVRVNALFLRLLDEKREEIENKCKAYDTLVSGKGVFSMGVVAKSFRLKDEEDNILGRNKLFEILRNNKVLQSSKSNWNIPYQNYIKNGYFRVLFKTVKDDITIATTRITPKGLEFLHDLIITLGYSYEGSIREIETFVSNDDYSEDNVEYK